MAEKPSMVSGGYFPGQADAATEVDVGAAPADGLERQLVHLRARTAAGLDLGGRALVRPHRRRPKWAEQMGIPADPFPRLRARLSAAEPAGDALFPSAFSTPHVVRGILATVMGFISTFEEAERVAGWANDDDNGAEPEAWWPWLVSRYPLSPSP